MTDRLPEACRAAWHMPLISACIACVLSLTILCPAARCDGDSRGEAILESPLDSGAQPGGPLQQRIDALIQQLGSPQFSVRRLAANELQKIGPEAFDQLHSASDDADPEIAASSRYLLRQIAVRWTRSDDSATVRRLLRRFGEQEDDHRQRVIQALAELPQREGVAALCRIARFDRSPRLSRLAALAVVQPEDAGQSSRPVDPAVIDRELGESTRIATRWLRQYQLQLQDAAASVAGWQQLIDEESARLDANVEETSPAIVTAMLWNLADVYRRLGQAAPLVGVADRIVAVSGDDSDRMIAKLLQWLLDQEAWEALDQFHASYDGRIRQTKRALYLVALAHDRQGRAESAEELAGAASQLNSDQPLEGLDAARVLTALGQFEWAVKEFRQGFDDEPLESLPAIASRVLLSNLLQDYEHYRDAAQVIEPLAQAVENSAAADDADDDGRDDSHPKAQRNRALQRAYNDVDRQLAQLGLYLPEAETLPARRQFLLACHYEQQRDWSRQRTHLLNAIRLDQRDADVLIAMYRLHDADNAWQADTRRRIRQLADVFEAEIRADPNDPIPYNQWAWLIANTEGDYAKAVRYSRRSLELAPETASFLDTLGRCYYAVGDYERAVKSQREAVQLIPHMQVMQRQLALFEKVLAEKP